MSTAELLVVRAPLPLPATVLVALLGLTFTGCGLLVSGLPASLEDAST
jgi:hypothetical protein